MVRTVRPKASETPSNPIPTCGNPAAMTAEPHPANVSQNVPIASATYFLIWSMVCSSPLAQGAEDDLKHNYSEPLPSPLAQGIPSTAVMGALEGVKRPHAYTGCRHSSPPIWYVGLPVSPPAPAEARDQSVRPPRVSADTFFSF